MRFILFIFFIMCITSCTIYTEKQSDALSKTLYATKDSLEAARFDLADKYSTEATRIVKPPKERIKIESVYKKTIDVIASQSKDSKEISTISKNRIIIIPEKYKNDTVVVVNSLEYEQLLKDKEVFKQIEEDNKNLIQTKQIVDQELIKQLEYNDKMIKDLNIMQKKLIEKDLVILQRNIVIVLLLVSIAGGIYLRIKGIL